MDEYEIYNRLFRGLDISLEGIGLKKDGEIIRISSEGLVKILFDSSDLTDSEKSVMRYMSIMPVSGIEIKLFEGLTSCLRKEILGLKKAHWIILDEEKLTIRLHPLICEAILSFDDAKPTKENCAELIRLATKKVCMLGEENPESHIFIKIFSSYSLNVLFREMENLGDFDRLKDKFKDKILFQKSIIKAYASSNSPEELSAALIALHKFRGAAYDDEVWMNN